MDKLEELISRYPALSVCKSDIRSALEALVSSVRAGGTILLCGNGGSAADCEHIAGELLKGFLSRRKMSDCTAAKFRSALGDGASEYVEKLQGGIPAVSLPSQAGVLTAYSNDVDAEFMYAQLVYAYAKENDVLVTISTSGNSHNCVRAAETAKALGIKTVALTGANESRLSQICDVTVRVPETETFKVQEYHLPVYHCLCAAMEEELFK
ncbi:MAG: SIS domain-containing protein [Clostridia bacterium]|nr:SIS domain-containing protein [Clostridia bacterium]